MGAIMEIPNDVKAVAYPITQLLQDGKQRFPLEKILKMYAELLAKEFDGETLIKCVNSQNEEIMQNYEMIILIIIFLERVQFIKNSKRPDKSHSIKHAVEHWIRSDENFELDRKYVNRDLVVFASKILGLKYKIFSYGEFGLYISKKCKFYNYYSDYQNF
jgi:hypothetical protein